MPYKVHIEGEDKFFDNEEGIKDFFKNGMKLTHIGGKNYHWYRENMYQHTIVRIEEPENEDFNFVTDIKY